MNEILTTGQVLKWLRKSHQISQARLAKTLNLSVSSIYRFEHGGNLGIKEYLGYCAYLKIPAYIPLVICENEKWRLLFYQLKQGDIDVMVFEGLITDMINQIEFARMDILIKND